MYHLIFFAISLLLGFNFKKIYIGYLSIQLYKLTLNNIQAILFEKGQI